MIPEGDKAIMWMSNQAPHGVKGALEPLYAEQAKGGFQVIVPDVGGGFGGKIPPYPEDALLPWLADGQGYKRHFAGLENP